MRRLVAPLLIFCTLTFVNSRAQDVEIFGYYEPQYVSAYIDDDYSQLFSNKLRLDFQSSPNDRVTFGANLNYLNYQGRTNWNLLEFLPENIADSAPPGADSLFNFVYHDSLILDNAFAKLSYSIFDLTLGKQQISVGTGYAWNPTDLLNIKDVIDPTYEQTGHTAIRLDAALSPRYSAMAVLLPETNWLESGKILRLMGKVSHFDYSAIYVENPWQLSDFIGFHTLTAMRHIYGGDFAGELLGLGVWGEFGYNTLNGHDDFWEVLSGIDYTFDNGLYLMAEYYHNELGKSDCERYDINDWLRFLSAESRTISRDILYIFTDFPLTDLIHINNSIIFSLNDGSMALVPSLQYSMFQNVDANLFFNINIGADDRAYSGEQGYGGIARLRVYF